MLPCAMANMMDNDPAFNEASNDSDLAGIPQSWEAEQALLGGGVMYM